MPSQDRYELPLLAKTLPDGRIVFRPNRLKIIETDAQDITLTVGPEDRMDIISNNVYGTAAGWWRIATVNGFKGSLHFKPGDIITVPRNL